MPVFSRFTRVIIRKCQTLPHTTFFSSLPNLSRISTHAIQSRVFPKSGFNFILPSCKVEEETLPQYEAERFYPAQIGEVLNSRYQIIGKLGYGTISTVWLCHDLIESRYVTIKVYVRLSKGTQELEIYKHINSLKSTHYGMRCLRTLIDSFEIAGPHGRHTCLVHPPLGRSLSNVQKAMKNGVDTGTIKFALRQVLGALAFLHDEAKVIHTDVQPNNILLSFKNDTPLLAYEEAELNHPIQRKVIDGRTIYPSRSLPFTSGAPLLCDLSSAHFGGVENTDDIMPDLYRAPEVIFRMPWSYEVDIWSVGMLVWDLLDGSPLFYGRDDDGILVDEIHLAEMHALLGPPPPQFLERNDRCLEYWDQQGNWICRCPIPDATLEQRLGNRGGEEKTLLLAFLRRTLCWLPEDRATAEELLVDDWILDGLFPDVDDE